MSGRVAVASIVYGMGISVSNVDVDECNNERRERLEEARFISVLCCCSEEGARCW